MYIYDLCILLYVNHTSLTQSCYKTKILQKVERRDYKGKVDVDVVGARQRSSEFIHNEPQVVTKTPDGFGDSDN